MVTKRHMNKRSPQIVKPIGREASIWEARAGRILQYISWKSKCMLLQRNRAIEVFLNGSASQSTQHNDEDCIINWHTIEQFTAQWMPGISPTPEIRAALAHLTAGKYALVHGQMPYLWDAVGLNNEDVRAAHQRLYDQPLEELFVNAPPTDCPLETLPQVDWMNAEDLLILQKAVERVHLNSGEMLFKEGEPGDCMYVISSGRVQVMTQTAGQTRLLAERGRDELIGEMAILIQEKRSASVYALRDTELYRITQATFEEMVVRYPRITMQMTRVLARRLSDTARLERRAHPNNTIAVLTAGCESDTTNFAIKLAQALSRYGTTMHLNSHVVDQCLEKTNMAQSAQGSFEEMFLTSWLNDCEENHDFVIYEADTEMSEWTQRCIRQSDRLLLVGQAERNPQCNALEEMLFHTNALPVRATKELVLLHENSGCCPSGTRAWLDLRDVTDHHHISLSNPAHMSRMARMLVNKPICLILGGGGTRGYVHIGVLRALREVGITADIVCGSSIGSLIAALVALGLDDLMIEKRSKAVMGDSTYVLSDLTLPKISVIAGKRLNAALKKLLGDAFIEDLWIKFFCTSVDLTDARINLHRQGLVRKYVRASCSLPVVFPPVLDKQHLLIDGGVMNNIPIDPMLEIAPGGILIAVNISPDFYSANENFNYKEDQNFLSMLNALLNPFTKKMIAPSIGNILMRTIEIGGKSLEATQMAKANLCIQVLGGPSILSPANPDMLIQMGYEATQKSLASEQGQTLLEMLR